MAGSGRIICGLNGLRLPLRSCLLDVPGQERGLVFTGKEQGFGNAERRRLLGRRLRSVEVASGERLPRFAEQIERLCLFVVGVGRVSWSGR